jgi:glyoxylase-like metal-dependent hydrolase (beta-lactamase superfamily II)
VSTPEILIERIRAGITNTYLIRVRGGGTILVDPGDPWRSRGVVAKLRRLGALREIGMMLATHGHLDHVGSGTELQRATAAPIVVHEGDAAWVRGGVLAIPPGFSRWGRTLGLVTKCLASLVRKVDGITPDRILTAGEVPLAEEGIPGRVVHTPGHTRGSVSLLLDTGDAFVGDLATNGPPFCLRPSLFPAGDDLDQMRASWEHLLRLGARTIHPGHGRPFPAETLALGRRGAPRHEGSRPPRG